MRFCASAKNCLYYARPAPSVIPAYRLLLLAWERCHSDVRFRRLPCAGTGREQGVRLLVTGSCHAAGSLLLALQPSRLVALLCLSRNLLQTCQDALLFLARAHAALRDGTRGCLLRCNSALARSPASAAAAAPSTASRRRFKLVQERRRLDARGCRRAALQNAARRRRAALSCAVKVRGGCRVLTALLLSAGRFTNYLPLPAHTAALPHCHTPRRHYWPSCMGSGLCWKNSCPAAAEGLRDGEGHLKEVCRG